MNKKLSLQQEELNNEMQKNNISKKRNAKRPNSEKLSAIFFRQRESQGKTPIQLRQLSEYFIDEANENHDVISLEDICKKLGIHKRRLYDWNKISEEFYEAIEFTKQTLGMKREHIIWQKKPEAFLDYQSHFLMRYEEMEEKKHQRAMEKAKKEDSSTNLPFHLQVIDGKKKKVVLVNSNIKRESDDDVNI